MTLLRFADLKDKVGFSKPHIWRLTKRGAFPKPLKLVNSPGGRNYWDADEVDAFIAARKAARDTAAA
jgi:predicted DNA-binding transcriptional regulator AlpA